jgi:hypothetical protein
MFIEELLISYYIYIKLVFHGSEMELIGGSHCQLPLGPKTFNTKCMIVRLYCQGVTGVLENQGTIHILQL